MTINCQQQYHPRLYYEKKDDSYTTYTGMQGDAQHREPRLARRGPTPIINCNRGSMATIILFVFDRR